MDPPAIFSVDERRLCGFVPLKEVSGELGDSSSTSSRKKIGGDPCV